MKDEISVYLDRLFRINVTLFPYIISQGIVLFLVETFTYKGFVSNYLFLQVEIWLIAGLLSGFIALLTAFSISRFPKNTISLYKLFKFLMPILTANMLLIYILLLLGFSKGESTINYGGRFLIYPDRFAYAIILALYFTIVSNVFIKLHDNPALKNMTMRLNKLSTPQMLFTFISLFIILLLSKYSLSADLALFTYNVKNIIKAPLASYSDKMIKQIGPVFKYYEFVNQHTPESAVILHPTQQGQWPDVSNAGYTRYFIYPRNLLAYENLEHGKDDVTHVFVIGDRKLHDNTLHNRWPDFYVPAEKVIYYLNDDNKVITVEGDYDPKNLGEFSDYWGIIEVKKGAEW